jgi:protein disulfide-isomerase-like protein
MLFASAVLIHVGTLAVSVQELTEQNFERQVLSSDEFWIVEFYAPWCGHCQNLGPEYEKAATKMRNKANFGAVDCTSTVGSPVCGKYGVHSFPTIKGFGKNKRKPKDYAGPRDAKGLLFYVQSACKRGLCKKKMQKKKGRKEKGAELVENLGGLEGMHKFIHKYSNRKAAVSSYHVVYTAIEV